MMKRLLTVLIVLVMSLSVIGVANADGVTGWSMSKGTVSEVTTPIDGVKLEGSSIDATYTGSLSLQAFMTDLYVDLSSIDFTQDTPTLVYSIIGDSLIYTMTLNLSEDCYDVVLGYGELSHTFSGVKYGDGGRIQLRLAYDNVMDFETGTRMDAWNMVAGCNPSTNPSINRFRESSFSAVDTALSAETAMEISVGISFSGVANGVSIVVTQIGYECFYTYETLPAPEMPKDENLTYSKINLSWAPPTTDVVYKGFVVERYNGDTLEAVYNLNDRYASQIKEKKLLQGTTYTYVIKAFETIDLISSKIACTKIAFEYEPISITTPKGDPTGFIIVCILGVVALAGVILGYIFWYDIKKLFKRA